MTAMHTARYKRGTQSVAATAQYGKMTIDKQVFPRVEPTPSQEAHILREYGKRPLRVIGQEVGLNARQARVVVERMKRDGRITDGPGLDWRKTMQAHGYDPSPMVVQMGWISPRLPIAEPSTPFCPSGAPHHRVCGPLIEKDLPDYYATHERAPYGCELQVCRRCGDRLIIRLNWSRGDDAEDGCEVA